jgi:hypothetical protein
MSEHGMNTTQKQQAKSERIKVGARSWQKQA